MTLYLNGEEHLSAARLFTIRFFFFFFFLEKSFGLRFGQMLQMAKLLFSTGLNWTLFII